ncbi:retrotransposon protein, putative, ty1-copia subclass [Tanacetum coccineum]
MIVMALPVQNVNHSAFRSMFEREKLFGNNFNDWFHQLKLVLRVEKKMLVIEQPIPPAPAADFIANELKSMFEKQAGVERFDLFQTFLACKQEEGKPLNTYVLKMKGYLDQLKRLSYVLPQDLSVGLILNGLTSDFVGFVRNYNMHNMGKTIGELHAMLIEYEKGLPKKVETPQVMVIRSGKIQKANKKSLKAKGKGKANGKGKDKQVYILKSTLLRMTLATTTRRWGHWNRNCLVYLAKLLKKKKQVGTASSSVICLDNCHYAPTITRGVVSVHHLVENGFVQCFTDYGILVSKNDDLYFNAIPCDGIYEIDMHNPVPNVNSIYNVSNKRVKHNLDSTYLWNCRLAHISKKRIEKLQHEGILKSTDDESFDQCVSCLSGKMTRKPFPHHTKRATDLLGIIHTDVCSPLRHVSRQGTSYFITFTDEYSRYGYVYLLKHKHEVFETFKVFKNEVENQLGKTIKALRSDRGGEYISQEFKDYLKACGIDYALESTTRIINMVPTKKVDKTPYELWYGKVPNLSYLKKTMGYYFYFPPENKIVVASKIPMEVEGFKPPQEEEISIRSYKAAMLDPESNKWLDAMNAEIQSMIDNKGVDYEETFSPVADIRAIRVLISIAAFYDYKIWQMDVKTAFLSGYLDKDIYMVQPEGFVDPNHPRKVYKLQRSIYGLKQASRSWNIRFDEKIKKFGFAQNLDKPCVYQKASGSNEVFVSHAWRRLFGIRAPLVQEFILEFFSTCRIVLGLHTAKEMAEDEFGAYWLGSERVIPDKGDLSDYWVEISSGKDFLRGAPSYTYIRDPVRRLCHRLISYSISERRQAPKKVIRRTFYWRLAHHFGLVSDDGLRGLLVMARELPLIDMGELVKLNICMEIGDDWAWVAPGPERQPDEAAGALRAAKDAPAVDEGAQADPAPMQAPQPPPLSPVVGRTMP